MGGNFEGTDKEQNENFNGIFAHVSAYDKLINGVLEKSMGFNTSKNFFLKKIFSIKKLIFFRINYSDRFHPRKPRGPLSPRSRLSDEKNKNAKQPFQIFNQRFPSTPWV